MSSHELAGFCCELARHSYEINYSPHIPHNVFHGKFCFDCYDNSSDISDGDGSGGGSRNIVAQVDKEVLSLYVDFMTLCDLRISQKKESKEPIKSIPACIKCGLERKVSVTDAFERLNMLKLPINSIISFDKYCKECRANADHFVLRHDAPAFVPGGGRSCP
jgi:hypothetical protein